MKIFILSFGEKPKRAFDHTEACAIDFCPLLEIMYPGAISERCEILDAGFAVHVDKNFIARNIKYADKFFQNGCVFVA